MRAMKTIPRAPQIVLSPTELEKADRHHPAIMPLGSALATASVEWHAPVYWVSTHDPADVLGALLEAFHGIYHSPAGQLCIQLDDHYEFFLVPKPIEAWEPVRFQRLMARVLQLHIAGMNYSAIAAEIRQQAGNLSDQVAA
jgi:hypothetical protein